MIGGSSAGATIQGEYLVRGDTSGPNVDDDRRNRTTRRRSSSCASPRSISTSTRATAGTTSFPSSRSIPKLLGIGLSEGTAIIVKGDTFEVMGEWKVAVHDNTRLYQPWEKPYFVLSAGDVYNMKTRKVEKYGTASAAAVGRRPGGER